MKRYEGPTYQELVQSILAAAAGPVAVDHLVDEVQTLKVIASKNPRRLVRSKLREFVGTLLVDLDADHVLPISLAYQGARFRIRLSHEAIDQGAISAGNFENFLATKVRFGGFAAGG